MKINSKGNTKTPPKNTSWGGVANWYDEHLEGKDKNDTYQTTLILPNLKRLVDPKPGQTILDLACGQGFFARAWANSGATVLASDVASELIEIAKSSKSVGGKVDYFIRPSSDISFMKDGTADVITCVLAIQNIEDLSLTLKETARVLKPKTGRLYIILNHPAFRIPKHSSWQFDENGKVQFRRIDGYMSDDKLKIDMNPGSKNQIEKQYTVSFHRPLQVYFKAFAKAGLAVTKLEEWVSNKESLPGKRSEAENIARREIPLFMCIEIVRL